MTAVDELHQWLDRDECKPVNVLNFRHFRDSLKRRFPSYSSGMLIVRHIHYFHSNFHSNALTHEMWLIKAFFNASIFKVMHADVCLAYNK